MPGSDPAAMRPGASQQSQPAFRWIAEVQDSGTPVQRQVHLTFQHNTSLSITIISNTS